MAILEKRLCAGEGWAFLPDHLNVEQWLGIVRLKTELGENGLSHPMVALSKPGQLDQSLLRGLYSAMEAAWIQDTNNP